MQTIEKVKQFDIKALIEKETETCFNKTNQLEKCPFCGSGKGTNQSPAFSIKKKNNFYKCFSCGAGGSTIDFLISLNSGWNEHKAIKYLQEEYLSIKEPFQPSQNVTSAFEKMLYAIKNNPKETATEYLKYRGISFIDALPDNSYWYDSHANAIVFIDANNQLINCRIINPTMGKPKAKNNGTLNGSIYDKMYNPDYDVVFIQEGVVNALSMKGCSSISLFSTENKIKNPKILQKYIEGKIVVLAMDNDSAGNKCAEYYQDFILSNRFNIKSLRRLILPENKDATITNDNKLLFPDKLGIVNHGKSAFYLPPFAYTNHDDKSYSGQCKFTYKAGNLNFKEWSELIYKAYGINGAIGISFIILALYRDFILELTGFFSFLFLFGDQGLVN